jgi:Cu+-exporting ATPase
MMRIFYNVCLVAAMLVVFTSCKDEAKPEVKTVEVEVANKDDSKALNPDATYAKLEFGIEGMTCAMGCAKTIEKKMAKMDGVKSAKVDFDKRLAIVEYDEAMVTPKSLEEAVAKVGEVYKVKDMKVVDDFGGEAKSCEALCKEACASNKDGKSTKDCTEACKKKCAEKAVQSK